VQALIAREADGRVVALNWQNNVTEPILAADLTAEEVGKVTKAIQDHVPTDAVVLSWWDLSRKIRLVSQRNAPLDDPLARGLLLPASWSAARPLIQGKERAYWGAAVPEQDGKVFSQFIDALLLDEEKGAAALAALAPGKKTFVAVHLSDIWKVAMERPDSLAILSKDFPGSATHGVMRTASRWLRDQKLDASYAVEPIGNAVRVHYLSRPADSQRLIARMLPFTSSNPMQLTHLKLVYQHRGFWIYELDVGKPANG
jgi:hydroxylamine oxidation protein HaoB